MSMIQLNKLLPRGGRFLRRLAFALVMLVATVAAAVVIRHMDSRVALAQGDNAPPDSAGYSWTLISDGFDRPLYVTYANDGSGRLFGVEQTGMVWIIDNGVQSDAPFLDISGMLPPGVFRGGYSEQGLLGLAFHPDFAENGLVFVSYNDLAGDTVISRFSTAADNPNTVDAASEVVILTADQPFENHNGGHIAFGPDGYLYISMGDGGDQGDPFQHGQNPESLLGKILRIDVNTAEPYAIPDGNAVDFDTAFAPEVYLTGFRNPWRFSFDRATDDLYIGDVGEWQYEEINFFAAGSSAGANFGWEAFEGNLARGGGEAADFVSPAVEYSHDLGCSVTGGYVYRGEAMPELQGYYVYGDYCVGNLWLMWRDDAGNWQSVLWMRTGRQISSFGEDEQGELYLVDYKGEILRLEAGA
jgi:glucose/arabinose dehydrogenase